MMEQLQFQDALEARQTRRQMQELGMQKTEQEMRLRETAAQEGIRGRKVIEEAMTKASPIDEMANSVQNISTDEIERNPDFTALGMKLGTIQGFESQSQTMLNLGQKMREHALKQSQEDRDEAQLLSEQTANPFGNVSRLEDEGKIDEAKQLYDQTINFVLNDPRYKDNEMIQQFYGGMREYKKNRGKLIYLTTMAGNKSRDQAQKERQLDIEAQKVTAKDTKAETKRADELRDRITNDNMVLSRLKDVITSVEANPNAIGMTGWVKKQTATIAGQLGFPVVEEWAETKGDIQTRARINMLAGVLIPYVTGDTSGRYSDADMKRVDEINEGKNLLTTPRQITETASEVIEIIKRGQVNAKQLLVNPNYDVNQPAATATGEAGARNSRIEKSRSYYMRPK